MRLRVLFILTNIFLAEHSYALDENYAVSKIPLPLLVNANAVVRFDETKFEISSTKETIQTNHYVITVLNESGDSWASFEEYYYKFREITFVEGVLYDAMGKQLKRVKKKDFDDVSGVSDGSLMDDIRIRRHDFYMKTYPYTLEYTVEITNKGSLFFPMWAPQPKENVSVEQSSMTIVCSPSYQFRYRSFNYTAEPSVVLSKGKKITTWQARLMAAVVREPYSPQWHEFSTIVLFGPTEFQVQDYKGNMASWQDYGKFVYALKAGRDKLPDNVKQVVHQLADTANSPAEKVSRLYEYLQQNTRYVSIQLGIGGWQPFDAEFVAAKGYGDCKALSNYMYSLLKEAGINSYYTLIRAGRTANYITEDFPSQQFNHVILCVPLENDTIWLECTSQTLPAGYLSEFTANRPALLIDENGGKMVHTPVYGIEDNQQVRIIKAVLQDNGNISLNSFSHYTGLQQDDIHYLISHLSKEKVKDYLHEQLDFATYDISRFEYSEKKSRLPVIDESLTISVSNYATITGKRLFVVPNMMTRSYRQPTNDSARKYPVQLNGEYTEVDSVSIQLPAGYKTEVLPAGVNLHSKFGTYTATAEIKDGVLHYYRRMEQVSGRFPASDFNELAKFYQAIYKADRNRVVLIKE